MFKNKKVLLVGLGILGGGVGTANYLLKEGADLAITDLKTALELNKSIKKIKERGHKVTYRLGKHDEKDFKWADIIVFNQSVPFESRWVKFAKQLKKPIESDLTIFSRSLKENKGEYISLTGTRGKTTTTNWLAHFLPEATMGGNMPDIGLAYLASLKKKLYVLELSSFQLEYSNRDTLAPKIAIITNIYVDHLNYHGTLQKYFAAKFKIFKNQNEKDFLIINRDNKNTPSILKAKPKAKIYFFSLSPLGKKEDGIFTDPSTTLGASNIIFQENGKQELITKLKKDFSSHQKSNLLPAMLTAHLHGKTWKEICSKIDGLPQIPFRQEIILKNKNLTVVNDSAATSPEATLAAIDKFKTTRLPARQENLILISGGTDKQLDLKNLAKEIKKYIKPENLYLLDGSATNKLIRELNKLNYKKGSRIFSSLQNITRVLPKEGVILFSPAAASFEKFKNEFDRGEQFNKLIRKIWKQ